MSDGMSLIKIDEMEMDVCYIHCEPDSRSLQIPGNPGAIDRTLSTFNFYGLYWIFS